MEPEIAIASKCGQIQGSRPRQEDYVAGGPTPRGDYLFVLADGMGGYEGGDQASEEAVRAFCESMRQEADLEGALHAANNRLAALKAQGKMPPDAGCTLIGVLLQEGICRAISVGDSLLYGYSGENGLKLLNRLHNKGAELDAMARNGQITPEQARSAPQRHALTSAVMGGPIRCVDLIDSFPLHHGDRLVLASDGCLTLGRQGLEDILRATPVQGGDDPEKIAGDILGGVERARRPRQDNASVIVVQAMRAERESFPLDPLPVQTPARKPSVFNLQALLCICLCCAVLALLSMFAYQMFSPASQQSEQQTGQQEQEVLVLLDSIKWSDDKKQKLSDLLQAGINRDKSFISNIVAKLGKNKTRWSRLLSVADGETKEQWVVAIVKAPDNALLFVRQLQKMQDECCRDFRDRLLRSLTGYDGEDASVEAALKWVVGKPDMFTSVMEMMNTPAAQHPFARVEGARLRELVLQLLKARVPGEDLKKELDSSKTVDRIQYNIADPVFVFGEGKRLADFFTRVKDQGERALPADDATKDALEKLIEGMLDVALLADAFGIDYVCPGRGEVDDEKWMGLLQNLAILCKVAKDCNPEGANALVCLTVELTTPVYLNPNTFLNNKLPKEKLCDQFIQLKNKVDEINKEVKKGKVKNFPYLKLLEAALRDINA